MSSRKRGANVPSITIPFLITTSNSGIEQFLQAFIEVLLLSLFKKTDVRFYQETRANVKCWK
jgi:hypothetical protein